MVAGQPPCRDPSSPSPAAPALSPLIIVLAAAAPGRKSTVVQAVSARDAHVGSLAHREAALGLVVQRHDKLGALVRLAVQRLVRGDGGGGWDSGAGGGVRAT